VETPPFEAVKALPFEEVRAQALAFGWDDMGATIPEISSENIQAYYAWLQNGLHADLHYMENRARTDSKTIFPGAKTALIFVSYYKQEKLPFKAGEGLIASYARGRDYHHVHRKRLKKMIAWLEERSGQTGIARGFSDSAPVLEKALAVQAGLGWFGKNTLLIHRRFGTFTLLSGLFTSLEISHKALEVRLPRCGSCTRCLDGCPTQALTPYRLDAAKCLSYHLIESKNDLPEAIIQKNPGYVFGCDICQDVCPHNVRKNISSTPDFNPSKGLGAYLNEGKLKLLNEKPETLHGTPLQRRGVEGLRRNQNSLK